MDYEKREIIDYYEIFYLGLDAEKPAKRIVNRQAPYQIVIKDHVAYRYEVIEILGEGTFG